MKIPKLCTPVVGIDLSTPVVNYHLAPEPNALGWNNTPVDVVFSGTDAVSGIEQCSSSFTAVNEGRDVLFAGYCSDYAGWTATAAFSLSIDTTPPSMSYALPTANEAGWHNSDVAVGFSCSDNLSGVGSCPGDISLSVEGVGLSTSTKAYDHAGNSAEAMVTGIRLDKTAPESTIILTGALRNGWYSGVVKAIVGSMDSSAGVKEIR